MPAGKQAHGWFLIRARSDFCVAQATGSEWTWTGHYREQITRSFFPPYPFRERFLR